MSPTEAPKRLEIEGPLNGVRFSIDVAGTIGSATPVVWLHGEFGEMGSFGVAPRGAALIASTMVIVPHLPGWGLSVGVEHFTRLDDLAMAVWWALDRLGSDTSRVVLGGHGLGAALGAEMAAQQPGRCAGVLLAAPFGMFRADEPGIDVFGTMPSDLMPHLYADPTGPLQALHFPAPVDAHHRGLAAIRRVETLGAAGRFVFPIPDTGIADRLYRLADVPVALVFGARDGIVPVSLAADWAAALPHAHVEIVESASHMVPYETDDVERLLGALATVASSLVPA